MPEKSHARSPEKRNFSIALPKVLIAALEGIAEAEDRSRNKVIERFLNSAVSEYLKANVKKPLEPKSILTGLPNPQQSERRKAR